MTFFIRPWSALGALAVLAVSATTPAFAAAPVTTASGLIYESLKDGTGPSPKASDTVRVHYRGTFPESGKEFDSSIARGQPIEFPLTGVIPCCRRSSRCSCPTIQSPRSRTTSRR